MAGKPYDPACPECGGRGFTWTEPHQCTCGTGEQGYYGMHEPLCGAEPCAAGCEVQPPRDCPDGGSCGHGCRAGGCFRVACCSPLSVWGDRWPAELVAAERAKGGPYWPDSETTGVTPAGVQGWHAVSEDHAGTERWSPVLQLDGWAPSLEVWFDSRAECERFIRLQVLGRVLRNDSETTGGRNDG